MSGLLATAGSNSSTSINFQLVKYTAGLVSDHQTTLLELASYEIPMYKADLEKASGIPEVIKVLQQQFQQCTGMILSVNEHNGNPSAFFKNILDWLSRSDRNFLAGTSIFLMSTSGGRRAGQSSRSVVEQMLPRFGGQVISTFSLPQYYENFDPESGITDPQLASLHRAQLNEFLKSI